MDDSVLYVDLLIIPNNSIKLTNQSNSNDFVSLTSITNIIQFETEMNQTTIEHALNITLNPLVNSTEYSINSTLENLKENSTKQDLKLIETTTAKLPEINSTEIFVFEYSKSTQISINNLSEFSLTSPTMYSFLNVSREIIRDSSPLIILPNKTKAINETTISVFEITSTQVNEQKEPFNFNQTTTSSNIIKIKPTLISEPIKESDSTVTNVPILKTSLSAIKTTIKTLRPTQFKSKISTKSTSKSKTTIQKHITKLVKTTTKMTATIKKNKIKLNQTRKHTRDLSHLFNNSSMNQTDYYYDDLIVDIEIKLNKTINSIDYYDEAQFYDDYELEFDWYTGTYGPCSRKCGKLVSNILNKR